MDRRELRAVSHVLGRLVAEVKGIPDEESNFPTFQPTCRQDLEVKSWQADLQPGDCFIGYYASIDLLLYGEVLVDRDNGRGDRPLLRPPEFAPMPLRAESTASSTSRALWRG